MNGGMHDAQCLVEHLVPVLQGADDSLLDRYSRRRRTIALEDIQRLSARNYRWLGETDPDKREEIWQELQRYRERPGQNPGFPVEFFHDPVPAA